MYNSADSRDLSSGAEISFWIRELIPHITIFTSFSANRVLPFSNSGNKPILTSSLRIKTPSVLRFRVLLKLSATLLIVISVGCP